MLYCFYILCLSPNSMVGRTVSDHGDMVAVIVLVIKYCEVIELALLFPCLRSYLCAYPSLIPATAHATPFHHHLANAPIPLPLCSLAHVSMPLPPCPCPCAPALSLPLPLCQLKPCPTPLPTFSLCQLCPCPCPCICSYPFTCHCHHPSSHK